MSEKINKKGGSASSASIYYNQRNSRVTAPKLIIPDDTPDSTAFFTFPQPPSTPSHQRTRDSQNTRQSATQMASSSEDTSGLLSGVMSALGLRSATEKARMVVDLNKNFEADLTKARNDLQHALTREQHNRKVALKQMEEVKAAVVSQFEQNDGELDSFTETIYSDELSRLSQEIEHCTNRIMIIRGKTDVASNMQLMLLSQPSSDEVMNLMARYNKEMQSIGNVNTSNIITDAMNVKRQLQVQQRVQQRLSTSVAAPPPAANTHRASSVAGDIIKKCREKARRDTASNSFASRLPPAPSHRIPEVRPGGAGDGGGGDGGDSPPAETDPGMMVVGGGNNITNNSETRFIFPEGEETDESIL